MVRIGICNEVYSECRECNDVYCECRECNEVYCECRECNEVYSECRKCSTALQSVCVRTYKEQCLQIFVHYSR